jgi:hypothetical protein
MKAGITLLRAVAVVCTGLALSACGGAMTEQEAAAPETEALATSEAELGSCANWSTEWYNTGNSWCDQSTACGYYWDCEPVWARGGDEASLAGGGQEDENIIYCPDGYEPVRRGKDATFAEQYSYRVCFDEAGNYTHTEYQYRGARTACGC